MNALSLLNLETDSLEFVEVDPTGRYGRYNEVLGKGASKTVFKGFDEYKGIEVAWNQVKLNDFLQSPQDLERLYSEIHLLKTLKHQNIMKFYTSWVDISNRNINFVTEMFTSGTLKQYREKHKRVNIRAVKHWCRQILEGLVYLHGHDPPVIHRDLKCDNIFINGHQGEVKIGDLGLAAILRKPHAAHCVGTPEFMAPEVYAEEYNELVDIYSFGMCVLEMVTFDYPYSECTHPAQIYKKVISGKKPDGLYKVKDPEVRRFIEKCLAAVSHRLSALELLNDPFLQIDDYETNLRPLNFYGEIDDMDSLLIQPYHRLKYEVNSFDRFCNDVSIENENGWDNQSFDIEQSGMELFECNDEELEEEHLNEVDVSIKGKRRDDGDIFLRLRISDKEGRIRNIYFPFDIETDTAFSVATEMVTELDITDQDVTKIADMIDGEIAKLVPRWNYLPGFEEINENLANLNFCQNCVSNHSSTGSLVNFMLKNRGLNNMQILQCCGNGCAATRGRFEEITYHIDGLKNHGSKGVKSVNLSRECKNVDPYLDVWDQYASLECSSEEGYYEGEHEKLDDIEIKLDHKAASCGENLIEFLSCTDSFTTNGSSSRDLSDNDDREIEQELRWVRAKYQMEMEKVRDRELGILPKCLKKHELNSATFCSVSGISASKPLQEESCEEMTVKSLSTSVPTNHHRTRSLPIDAVIL